MTVCDYEPRHAARRYSEQVSVRLPRALLEGLRQLALDRRIAFNDLLREILQGGLDRAHETRKSRTMKRGIR